MAHPLYEVTGLDESSLPSFTDEGPSISYEDDGLLMPSSSHPPGSKPDHIPSGGLGLGSLADELAGAMYDSDDEEYEEGEAGDEGGVFAEGVAGIANGAYADGVTNANDDTPVQKKGPLNRALSASDYDGSEYGDPDDLGNGISAGLEDKINQIEKLALRSRHTLKEEADGTGELAGVVPRLMEGLQKLGPQSSLETGSTRFVSCRAISVAMITLSVGICFANADTAD